MNKTEQELLDLLDDADLQEVRPLNNVIEFIQKYKLGDGEVRVTENLLFRLYKATTKNPLRREQFSSEFRAIFPPKVSGPSYYYYLNLDPLKLSEQLKKALESKSETKTKNPKYINLFRDFLKYSGIERGNTWIEGFVIYEIYKDRYRKIRKKHHIGYTIFHNFLKLNFEYKRNGSDRALWFGVNDAFLNFITKEKINALRKSRTEKARRRRQKRREQRKKVETN